ncbi:hypothetical protein [Streptomyces sp. NPDC054849]
MDLSNFNSLDHEARKTVGRQLTAFLGRVGLWRNTAAGQIVTGHILKVYQGTQSFALNGDGDLEIDVSGLTRKELSSLVRLMDDFARNHANTHEIRQWLEAVIAEDEAAQDPHAPRLIDC